MVNHLQTVNYHLGLVCALCLAFFTTSMDTMWKYKPCCKATAAKDWEEEETLEEDNSDAEDGYFPQEV